MRAIYFFLFFTLPYSLRMVYSKIRFVNKPKNFFGRTIFVSNHSASFMDPLMIASNSNPIVFFMTRSDVFTPVTKPFLWASHMLPIYRSEDGVDTKEANKAVFAKCTRILKNNRNLLIFAESLTDDVFVRRLKPLRKGAVRIGVSALDNIDWSKKIYIQPVGINYGNPNIVGSEAIISYGKSICLNDYHQEFQQDYEATVTKITLLIEEDLKSQLTHVEEYDWAFFHEHVTRLTRIGLDPFDRDRSIPIMQRWENSKQFAHWINQQDLEDESLLSLKQDLEDYFQKLNDLSISDTPVYEVKENKQNIAQKRLRLIALAPLSILGLIHLYFPYRFVKNFVEKTFKRTVFWSSVKMMIGGLFAVLWNIPLVMMLHYWLVKPLCVGFENYAWIISFVYYMMIPLIGLVAYYSNRTLLNIKVHHEHSSELKKLSLIRDSLLQRISQLSYFKK